MPTYGKRETRVEKQWRPFVFDLKRPALLEARQRALGVLRGGLGAEDTALR